MRREREPRRWRAAELLALVGVMAAAAVAAGQEPASEASIPAIVFTSRDLNVELLPARVDTPAQTARRGRLLVREANGHVRALVSNDRGDPALPVDVSDPDVSFDGTRVVFSGFSRRDAAWRIYVVGANGNSIQQLTRSDRRVDLSRYGAASATFVRYDDMDPCFLPDGRICFVSTRHPGFAPDGRLRRTNLYVMNADGSDLHRITSERFAGDSPAVDPATGKIVYSRWWRSGTFVDVAELDPQEDPVPPGGYYGQRDPNPPSDPSGTAIRGIPPSEFTGVNNWFLASIRPDGKELSMFCGFHLDRELTQAWRPSFQPNGEVLALFLPNAPVVALPSRKGLRSFVPGIHWPRPLGGPQEFSGTSTNGFDYASAVALGEGDIRLLVTAARVATQFDIYVQNGTTGELSYLYGTLSFAELDAVPLRPRTRPPVLDDEVSVRMVDEEPQTVAEAFEKGGSFTFLVENIHFNGPVDLDIPNAPPLGHELMIEFFMSPQQTGSGRTSPPILVDRRFIQPDGRVEVELPAGVPLFEVLKTAGGEIPVGRDGQVFHVGGMNFGTRGTTARCVGCHTGHSMLEVPDDFAWTNVAPSAGVELVVGADVSSDSDAAGSTDATDVMDRDTETALRFSEDGEEHTVKLEWPATVRAREIVLYAAAGADGEGSEEVAIDGVVLRMSASGRAGTVVNVPGPVVPGGTRVALDKHELFQELTIEVPGGTALAEVEVIAQSAADRLVGTVRRGDANCDGTMGLADAIGVLRRLFDGSRTVCCDVAADVDASDSLNITDGVFLLNHLFAGGPPPAEPSLSCGRVFGGSLGCERSNCTPE